MNALLVSRLLESLRNPGRVYAGIRARDTALITLGASSAPYTNFQRSAPILNPKPVHALVTCQLHVVTMGCFSSKEQRDTTEAPAQPVKNPPTTAPGATGGVTTSTGAGAAATTTVTATSGTTATAGPTETSGFTAGGDAGGLSSGPADHTPHGAGDAGSGPTTGVVGGDAGGRSTPFPMPGEEPFEREIVTRPNARSLRALRTLDDIPLRRL